jgi:DNA replication protein DnaC
MERLNDILGRTPQSHQQDTEQRLVHSYGTPSQVQRPGVTPSRPPLREQTAHVGSGSRSAQSHMQHSIAQHTRSEQGQSVPLSPRHTYSRQPSEANELPGAVSYQQHSHHQMNLDRHTRNEDFTSGRDRSWRTTGIVHADSADAYSTTFEADVREEWEDDTADMRYGDWENDANEEYTQFKPQEQEALASGMYPMSRPSVRSPRTYPRGNRSFVTRDSDMTPDGESRTKMGRNVNDSPIPAGQLPPPQQLSQETQRSVRMTQPLRPKSALRASQDIAQEGPHTPQLTRREQASLYTPVNSCPICKGAGYLRADVPYGHPSFGKPIACECKEAERKAKRRQQLQEMSNLGAFYDKSFTNFNQLVPGVQEAFRAAYEFAQNPNGWFLLIGPNGCGKTHLGAAIANQSLEAGALVLFATVPDLLDHLRAAFAPSSTEVFDQLFARMREAEVLVLDDLGAQQSSPWANEKLFQLLNYRYNSRFPTVITANSRGLQGIDERIRSRLTDASLVTTVILDRARDYRPQNPRRS